LAMPAENFTGRTEMEGGATAPHRRVSLAGNASARRLERSAARVPVLRLEPSVEATDTSEQVPAIAAAPASPATAGAPAFTPTSSEAKHLDYVEARGLLESVASGAVAALKGSFVLGLMMANKPVVCRQDLPAHAFWSVDEFRSILERLTVKFGEDEATRRFCRLFVALSYRWLSKAHPDPKAFHLKRVGDAARLYIADKTETSLRALVYKPLGLKDVDFGMFWDFASLYQKNPKRAPEWTDEQQALATSGLQASTLWYAHRHTVVWMQSALPADFDTTRFPTYEASGWCFVEACMSSVIKPAERRLDLGQRDVVATKTYSDVMNECIAARASPPPPMLQEEVVEKPLTVPMAPFTGAPMLRPEQMASALRMEKTFTVASDLEVR